MRGPLLACWAVGGKEGGGDGLAGRGPSGLLGRIEWREGFGLS